MLLIVLGAGASYDSTPSYPPHSGYQADRIPLADELFEDRPEFRVVRNRFQKCLPIIPYLLHRQGQTVEQVLQRLQLEGANDPERFRQLAAIRYYLHVMLLECQQRWESRMAGVSNYITLFDQVRHMLNEKDEVCIVTFNYDTLIEKALETVGNSIKSISDYVTHSRYKLFKLHGSVNWGRQVKLSFNDLKGYSPWEIANRLINDANKLNLSGNFLMTIEYPIAKTESEIIFPAIALPVEEKNEFECPAEHVEALIKMIPYVDKILSIGWRATEKPFLGLLKEHLKLPVQALVVAGESKLAETPISNMKQAGIDGDYYSAQAGFTDFIVNRDIENLLTKK